MMEDQEVKGVITVDDEFNIMKQKLDEVVGNLVAEQKQYGLIKLHSLSLDQYDEDQKYASKVKETIDKFKNLGLAIFQDDIISGNKKEIQFSKDEISELDKYFNPNNTYEQKIKNERFASNEITPINGYWFIALKQFDFMKPYIKDKDDQLFDIPNKAEGTVIEWFEGKDICRKTVKKSQKNRNTGAIRVITHDVEDESFFNFFNSLNLEEVEIMGQQKQNSLISQIKYLDRINTDFDIGRSILDELLPYSIEYYLGVRKIKPKEVGSSSLKFLVESKEDDDLSDGDDDNNEEENAEEVEKNKKQNNAAGKDDKQDAKKSQKKDKAKLMDKQNECNQQ